MFAPQPSAKVPQPIIKAISKCGFRNSRQILGPCLIPFGINIPQVVLKVSGTPAILISMAAPDLLGPPAPPKWITNSS